jgi:creatinine amidohydrolase/Fe(II)-dependent formamide hydrolase-like protein
MQINQLINQSINQCGRKLITFERNASRQFVGLEVSQILMWAVDISVVVNGHGGNKGVGGGEIARKVLRAVTG